MKQHHVAFAALAIVAGLGAGPVAAEGWSIYKLESLDTVDACMSKARRTISSYMFDVGGGETGVDTWSVYGYDLEPDKQDAVIICPEGPDGLTDALLVVQSESETDEREQVAKALVDAWNAQ